MSAYQTPDPVRKVSVWLPLLLASVLVVGMSLGFQLQSGNEKGNVSMLSSGGKTGTIEELLRLIETKYVDKTNREELVQAAIDKVLHELDPHSSYIPAAELQSVNEELDGKFEGVGIQFTLLKDTIFVVAAISGGPAEQLGILAGDKIVTIDDSLVAGVGMDNEAVIGKLKGKKGSKVKVGIQRGKSKKVLKYTITRDVIPLYSVDASYMLNETTGYIKVNRFSGTTHTEFMEALEKMATKENMKDIVIDLRGNPGGYLTAATKMLDQLFKEKRLLVYTEGRSYPRSDYHSTGRQFFPIRKIAVLIDEGSASASEILAGAIQDNDRGIIIGRRSFGKGLVQEQYDLSDGSALRLTVARYFTPSGRSIQKSYDNIDEYGEEAHNRAKTGELMNKDKVVLKDTTKYYTLEKHRVVYGGGGIMPDVFVPLDTTLFSNTFFADALQFVPRFVYTKYPNLKAELSAYKTIKQFNEGFTLSSALESEFFALLKTEGVKTNPKELSQCVGELRLRIKAYFARQMFQDSGYFYVMNAQDPVINAALKNLK
jgi:carboxyl-terminal processing protease